MNHFLRNTWFLFICRPLVYLLLGLNIRRHQRLVDFRPSIIVANHNSHLDAIVLMSIFPLRLLRYVRPVAAEDYFLKNRFLGWFARRIMGIVPISRSGQQQNPLDACSEVLDQGGILIFFPEGTRGHPEKRQTFKRGVEHLAKRHSDVPVIPVYMHGLGKALPKGDSILVPFFCDVFVGEPLRYDSEKSNFMALLDDQMKALASEGNFVPWD